MSILVTSQHAKLTCPQEVRMADVTLDTGILHSGWPAIHFDSVEAAREGLDK